MSERILLLSSAPPAWKPLTDITWQTHAKYAQAHGYGFQTDVSNIEAPARSPRIHERLTGNVGIAGFRKLDLLLHFLDRDSCRQEWDWVIWLDADALVSNYDIPLDRWLAGNEFVLPFDFNSHNATFIAAKNTDKVFQFLSACNTVGRSFFLLESWREMSAIRMFLALPPYQGMATYFSVKELCGIPPIPEYGLHPRVVGPYLWESGDFCIHFSALTLEKRVQYAREWVEKYNLL